MQTIPVRSPAILNSIRCKKTALLLLCLITILFFNLNDRYAVIGPELIQNPSFDRNLAEWTHSSRGVYAPTPAVGGIRIHSDTPTNFIHISQAVPGIEHYPLLRISYAIKTSNVTPGQHDWMTARLVLTSTESTGDLMRQTTYVLQNIQGTHPWEHRKAVFSLAAGTIRTNVSAQLAQATGTMWIKDLSLTPVVEIDRFRKLRLAVTALWTIVILWIAVPIARSALGSTHRVTIVALALAIGFGTLMPETLKLHIGSLLTSSQANIEFPPIYSSDAIFKFTPLLPPADIYKTGHFVMFTLLSIVALARRPYPISPTKMLGYMLLLALVTEVLQLLVVGRSAQIGDLIIDAAGIVTGATLLWAARQFLPTFSERKPGASHL